MHLLVTWPTVSFEALTPIRKNHQTQTMITAVSHKMALHLPTCRCRQSPWFIRNANKHSFQPIIWLQYWQAWNMLYLICKLLHDGQNLQWRQNHVTCCGRIRPAAWHRLFNIFMLKCEWVSSFLMAHQQSIGYSVPSKVDENKITS